LEINGTDLRRDE
jgi:bifunctional non-homologous end joining protein LigD